MKKNIKDGIVKLSSNRPGPTLAIFAGVHGDERVGVIALKNQSRKIKLKKGCLYIVFANPPAIKKDRRYIGKNLNRCFYKNNNGQTYEDKRARRLMNILDKCEALLDMHAYSNQEGPVFAICEKSAFDVAKIFDVEIISDGWARVEPGGTDGYMHKNNKVGICLEFGSISKTTEYLNIAEKSIFQFLKYYDMVDSKVQFSSNGKERITAKKAVKFRSSNFKMNKQLKNFQKLKKGEFVSEDSGRKKLAAEDEIIIFPNPNASVGHEAYIIARKTGRVY